MPFATKYCLWVLLVLSLIGCQSTANKNIVPESPYTYVDSTQYFAERTASVSMRASFNREGTTRMTEGYRFQFRTIRPQPMFLSSISIIAGGKRLFLEQGQIVLPSNQGVTLDLSLEDSQFVAQFPSALLQFRHNNLSEIYTIELHQLKEFSPQ